MSESLLQRIKKGERRALAQAITILESTATADRIKAKELLDTFVSQKSKSLRIGISGSPGVGKSTFIDVFGSRLIANGSKIAVLAIDPTSPISGGSILGDKTRMETLSISDDAFVRPSPGKLTPGGITANTHEVIQAVEYAGFDIVLLETVGIGQSETDVSDLVDVLFYLHQPESGDDLQAIKKGILEVSDYIIVTKADGALKQAAEAAARQINAVLHGTEPRVFCVSSSEKVGFDDLVALAKRLAEADEFFEKRLKQAKNLLETQIINDFVFQLRHSDTLGKRLSAAKSEVQKKNLRQLAQSFLDETLKK